MSDISPGQFSQLASAVVSSLWPAVRDAGPKTIQKWIEGERAVLESALQDALFPPYDYVYKDVEVNYVVDLPPYLGEYGPADRDYNGSNSVSTKDFELPGNLALYTRAVLELHLVRFHRTLKSPEIIEKLYQMHLRPGNIWELVALYSAHKKGGVALGSIAKDKYGKNIVPKLSYRENELCMTRFDAEWRGDSGSIFLAVSTR